MKKLLMLSVFFVFALVEVTLAYSTIASCNIDITTPTDLSSNNDKDAKQDNNEVTIDVEFRSFSSKNAVEAAQPPQLRSVRTQEVFSSSPQQNKLIYRFTGLPFDVYEFIQNPGELYIPLHSYELYEKNKEKTVIKPKTYYHSIKLCRVQLTPVKFTLENDWASSKLSLNLFMNSINKIADSELYRGLSEEYKYRIDNFEKSQNNNSLTMNMFPGNYECKVQSFKKSGQSSSTKPDYKFPYLTFPIPQQTDIYEAKLRFPDTGSIKGYIDTSYFDKYSANVYSSDIDSKETVLPKVFGSANVDKDSFFISNVPEGNYIIKLSAAKSNQEVRSEPFKVVADQTAPVEIVTDIGELGEYRCRIADFRGRPIRNTPILLKQGSLVSFGASDEHGDVKIPYRKEFGPTATIIVQSTGGAPLAMNACTEMIYLQMDQDNEIRFDGLTRFRFLVLDEAGNPVSNYYLQFEYTYAKDILTSCDFLYKNTDGWGEVEALPRRTTKIYGSELNVTKNGGLKNSPQLLMTHDVEDNVDLKITIKKPKVFSFRFFDPENQPIPNLSVFRIKEYIADRQILLRDWPYGAMKENLRTNNEGETRIRTTMHGDGIIYLYYHESYGLGYIVLSEDTPEQDIYLKQPAILSLQNVSLKSKFLQNHNLSIQIPATSNPLLFNIWLYPKIITPLKFQPGLWQMGITSSDVTFDRITTSPTFEEHNLAPGSTFTTTVAEKRRKSGFMEILKLLQ
jgi:hypothetical protein